MKRYAWLLFTFLSPFLTIRSTCASLSCTTTSGSGVCACQTGSFKAPITLPGLNALYLFDGDTRDSSGNGYDLTMTNGAVDPYSFLGANGVDPSLKIKDESTLLTRTATVASQNLLNNIVNGKPVGTLAVWVKDIRFVDGNDHQYGILGLNWADGKWFRLDVYASGKLVFVLYAGAWGTTSMFPECQNSPDWTRGGWWHIVFTSDGTNVGMQYRSAADASYTSCTLLSEQSGNPVISTWTATGSVSASSIETFTINVFNALNPGTLIDEVRVYNRVLSSEEILQVFDEKNNVCKSCGAGLTTLAPGAESADACVCSTGSFKTDAYDTNLIAHYGFDGDTRDLQNPGNVATLTGNGGIAYLDTTHKIFGSHSVKLTNDDGLKTYVLMPQFQLDTSLTISLWFRWDVTSLHDSDYTKLFYFSGDVKLYAAGDSSVSGDGEALYFVMYDQNNNRIEYKNSDRFYFSNNVWYHMSWVVNKNSEMRIFIDGEYVPRTNTDNLESGKFPLWGASANMNNNRIGTHASHDDGRDSIDGHVEEFRLYNTALPDSAVKALYEARGAPCMSCSSGLTTLAPGANSSDACMCPSGSFTNPLPPAVLHWNPSLADENMDGTSATIHQIPALNWNIASNGGFTIIMKVRVDATSDSYPAFLDISSSTASSGASTFIRIGENGATQHFIFETNDGSAGACGSEWPHLKMTWGAVYTIVSTYNQLTQTKGLYYDTSSTFSRTCSSEATMSCERTQCTDFTADLQDYVAVIGARARSDRHDSHAIAGKIYGVYGFDEVLTDAQIQTVIDSIVVDGEDDTRVLHGGACTACQAGLTTLAPGAGSVDQCVCLLGSYGPFVAPIDGLVSQFYFAENLDDAIGSSTVTVLSGATTYISDTDRGYALDTEPGKHVISGGGLGALLDQQSWTISFWFYTDSTSTQTVVGRFDDGSTTTHLRGGFFLDYVSTQRFRFRRWYQAASHSFTDATESSTSLSTGTWGHVTIISEPGYLTLYVNGVQRARAGADGRTWNTLLYQDSDTYDMVGVGMTCTAKSVNHVCDVSDSNGKGYVQDLRFYNRALSATEIGELAGGQRSVCAICPTEKPYTDPSHGATAEAQCQAPPASCDTITVTSDRKIIYEKTIHQDLGDADATWEGYMSWVSAHAGYTVPTVSQMNEFVETAEFADLKTASQIDPGGDHALTTDEWTPVYADDGITRKWYQIGYNSNYPRGTSIDFIYYVITHNTGWYFATFFPSDVTSSMVKVVSFHNSPSPYTLTFSAATTADVLVVSGSNYRYTTNVQVAGDFTVSISDAATSFYSTEHKKWTVVAQAWIASHTPPSDWGSQFVYSIDESGPLPEHTQVRYQCARENSNGDVVVFDRITGLGGCSGGAPYTECHDASAQFGTNEPGHERFIIRDGVVHCNIDYADSQIGGDSNNPKSGLWGRVSILTTGVEDAGTKVTSAGGAEYTMQKDYIFIKENAWCDGGVTYTNKYTHSNNPQKNNGQAAIEQSCFAACSAHASFNIRPDTGACYCFDASSEECTWDTDSSYLHYDIVAGSFFNDITASNIKYFFPQVILRYKSEVCPTTDTTDSTDTTPEPTPEVTTCCFKTWPN